MFMKTLILIMTIIGVLNIGLQTQLRFLFLFQLSFIFQFVFIWLMVKQKFCTEKINWFWTYLTNYFNCYTNL